MKTLAYAFVAFIALIGAAYGQVCAPSDSVERDLRSAGYVLTDEGEDGNGTVFRIYRMESGNWIIVYSPAPGMWCAANAGPRIRKMERGA
jgi:hypothetical protein